MALFIVAVLALVAWWGRGTVEESRKVRLNFPENMSSSAVDVHLLSCTTIEEAMLFKVMGVVSNCSSEPLRYSTAQAVFLDDQGNPLDSSRGCVVPEVLESQTCGRFVLVTQPDSQLADIMVTLTDSEGAPLVADYSLRGLAQGFVEP